jgi:hypothetical protein
MSHQKEYIFTHIGEIADRAERKARHLQSEAVREMVGAAIDWVRTATAVASN